MLVLDIDDIDRLQEITDALVASGCGFAAVFAEYDSEPRRHASSGDTGWFTAANSDPLHAAFTPISVTTPRSRVGITALLPTNHQRAACESRVLGSLPCAAGILERAMYSEDVDRRERERARNRLDRRGRGRERS